MAQSVNSNIPEENSKGFQMGGSAGSVLVNGETYSEIRLMPEVSFWKIGIGLDVDLLIDKNGNLRKEDWDQGKDYLNKIYYVRYAKRGDPFYARVGGFFSYTLSHGLIMKDYSNMLNYPSTRQIGVQIGVNTPYYGLGMEGFTSNIQENEIIAGRLQSKPIEGIGIPLLKDMIFGVEFATDRNQLGGLEDKDNDHYPDAVDAFPNNNNAWVDTDHDGLPDQNDADLNNNNLIDNQWAQTHFPDIYQAGLQSGYWDMNAVSDSLPKLGNKDDISIFGIDITIPLIERDKFKLEHYGEIAKIQSHGTGFIYPGFYSKFLIFDINLEMRHYGNEFVPAYFDQLYDDQRATISGDSLFITKESTIDDFKACTGWYGSITSNLFNFIYMTISYEDMYGDNVTTGKTIQGTIGAYRLAIPKLSTASISYIQSHEKQILKELRTPSTMIQGKVGYALSDNTELVAKYQERYTDANLDGKINNNSDEIIKTSIIGVEFHF